MIILFFLFLPSTSLHIFCLSISPTYFPPNVCHSSHPASPVSLFLNFCSFPFLLSFLCPQWNFFLYCGALQGGGETPVCLFLCLYPDSQPECPLCLWSAVELLSGKQQQQSRLQCASWIETLPYKALGTVAPANFFFLQNKLVSLLHTSSGETAGPLHSLFLVFAPLQ